MDSWKIKLRKSSQKVQQKTKKWWIRKLEDQIRQSNIQQPFYILFLISVPLLLLTWNDIFFWRIFERHMLFWITIIKVWKTISPMSYSLGPMLFFNIHPKLLHTPLIRLQEQNHSYHKPSPNHIHRVPSLMTGLSASREQGPYLWFTAVSPQ